MNKIEIIKDGTDWYLITPEGVQVFSRERASGLPFNVQRAIEKSLECKNDFSEDENE